jgi:DNA-binding NarL/FixJ family response regulator
MTVRVLLVDDQPMLRTGFRLIFASEPDIEVVGEAGDGEVARRQVAALRPDVVLMDIRMPGMDGVEATRRIVADHGADGVRVLILTTYDLDEYVLEALRAGASGFLLKDSPAEDLVDAVRIVHRGEAVVGPKITRRLLDRFAKHLPSVATPRPSAASDLTEREHDVLLLLAQGLSNAEIARALVVSETTVKSHVSHLLTKLGLRDRVQAVIYAYQSGLVDPR